MARQPIRVLLVDDHVVVRRGLAALFASLGNFVVAGEATDGDEALRLIGEVYPDLILMDLSMPRLGGLETTRRLRQMHPHTRILVLSMHEDPEYVAQALLAGAGGYLVKNCTPEELRQAVESVASGETFISPAVASPLVDDYLRQANADQETRGPAITAREIEVLQLIAEGHTTNRIAELLSISPHTAQHHRTNLKRKLGARSDAELIRIAIKKNLILTQ
jgi:DNA-binding NarL/FixJ family response regulator